MEHALVRDVSVRRGLARVTAGPVRGLADWLRAVDVRPVDVEHRGAAAAVVVPAAAAHAVAAAAVHAGLGRIAVERVAQVTLRAAGVRSDPVATSTFCEALTRAGVPLPTISPGSHGLAVVVAEEWLEATITALREAFESPVSDIAPAAPSPGRTVAVPPLRRSCPPVTGLLLPAGGGKRRGLKTRWSHGLRELGECCGQAERRRCIGSEFVVASAEVLYEGVAGSDSGG